jgi:uncharacterized protein YndB with AHSA1/START domain
MPSPEKKRVAVVTLPSATRIEITREFAAPKHLVYEVWTTPESIARWWPANRGEATAVEVDLRVGGRWRFAMVTEEGVEVAYRGEYLEVSENERIVATEVCTSEPAEPVVRTVTFTAKGGVTTVTMVVEAPSEEARDATLRRMSDGLTDALDLVEGLATTLAHASEET